MKKHENEFHGNYYQGKSQKQYQDASKFFLFSITVITVLLVIEFLIS